MSLLVDAQKKARQAQSPTPERGELSLETLPIDTPDIDKLTTEHLSMHDSTARQTGENLFAAKTVSGTKHSPAKRKPLIILGGTILLLGVGGAYFWYINSSDNNRLRPTATLNPAAAPTLTPEQEMPTPEAETLVPGITSDNIIINDAHAPTKPAPVAITATPRKNKVAPPPQQPSPQVRVSRPQTEKIDPLLSNAYQAYQNGDLGKAQQLYTAMLKKDAGDINTLLGLAAIAQRREDNTAATQYYSKVLALDPRNAVAYSGMTLLGNRNKNQESILKIMLREQNDSAALHAQLGSVYAEQSRWGEAQQAYFDAYRLQPDNAGIVFNLAISLDHLGQNGLAAQQYQRALQLDPSQTAGFDHTQATQRLKALRP